MLAVLGVSAPLPVLRDTIMGLLWSRREQEQARASFRQTLHELQIALAPAGDLLTTERGLVGLREEGLWCDVQAMLAGRPERADILPGRLGEDLEGLDPAFDRWLALQRDRLGRAATHADEQALTKAEADGDDAPEEIVAVAERMLARQPTHEGACRALMQAHRRLGRREAALAAYDRCAAALSDGAGRPPAVETRACRDALLGPEPRTTGIRLGVLPFRSLDDGDTAGLCVGLAEEITTALSRFRWMFLIASPSVAAIAHEPRAHSARWRALDLDFLLDGTVQRSGARVRVNARLLDLRGGEEIVWAQRFDREGGDILTLQDEIAAQTVAQVDPQLLLREGQRSQSRPPSSATAYDQVLRAIPALYRMEQAAFVEAGEALSRAVELDSTHAAAQAWWAYWHVFLVGQGWASDPEAAMARAGVLAERAVALDPSDARALTIAGHVQAFLHHRIPDAIALHDRALALNPNLPLAWGFAGLARSYAGAHAEAIALIDQALRLSPFDPHGFFFEMALMLPYLMLGDHERVIEQARRAMALNPGLSSTYKGHLSALGHLGRGDEAGVVRHRLLELEPKFSLEEAAARSPLLRAEDVGVYVEGLRLAGLAEQV